ncbi:hypothetical protein M405DRAFT_825361, partial [Rhizopogon salebrosus TDB-379]
FVNTADLEGHALYLPYWCNRSGALVYPVRVEVRSSGTRRSNHSSGNRGSDAA